MGFCIPRWTLTDNEAIDFNQLQLGTFFTLITQGITYYGTVDSSDVPSADTIKCKLFSDAARTIEVISGVPTGVPYVLNFFQGWKHDFLAPVDNAFRSNDLQIRVEDGIFIGYWRAIPLEIEGEFDFSFIGTYQEFALIVSGVNAVDNGAGSLAAGTYTYCVVAINSLGQAGAGSEGISVTVGDSSSVLITWSAVPGATQYKIYTSSGLLDTVNSPTLQFIDDGTIVPDISMLPPVLPDPALVAIPIPVDNGTVETGLQPDPSLGMPVISSTNIVEETFLIDPETGCIINIQEGSIDVSTSLGDFNIPNIASGVSKCSGIQIDPAFVDPTNLPVGAIEVTITITTVIEGDTITITELNSLSGEIKTLSINITTGAYTLFITHSDATISTITGVISNVAELLTTLQEGTLTTTTILDNFAIDINDVITADETIILNVNDDPNFAAMVESTIYIPDRQGRLYKSSNGGLNFSLVNSNVLFAAPQGPLPAGINSFAAGEGWLIQRASDTWQTNGTPKFYITNDDTGSWTPINGNAFATQALSVPMKMHKHNGVPFGLMIDFDGIIRIYPTLGIYVVDSYDVYKQFDLNNFRWDANLTAEFGDGYIYGLMQRNVDSLDVIVRRQIPATPGDPLGPTEEVYGPVPNGTTIPGLRAAFLAIPGKMSYVYQKNDSNVYRAISTDGFIWNETNLGSAALYAASGGPEQVYFNPNAADYFVPGVGIVAALGNAFWVSSDLEIWASVAFAGEPFDKFEALYHYAAPASNGANFYFIDNEGNETVLDAGFNALKLEQPASYMTAGDLAIQRNLRVGIAGTGGAGVRPPFNPSISIGLSKVPLAPPPLPISLPLSTRTRHKASASKPSFAIANRKSLIDRTIDINTLALARATAYAQRGSKNFGALPPAIPSGLI